MRWRAPVRKVDRRRPVARARWGAAAGRQLACGVGLRARRLLGTAQAARRTRAQGVATPARRGWKGGRPGTPRE
eukprot:7941085-Alexandrium_andersonii.AAC.1